MDRYTKDLAIVPKRNGIPAFDVLLLGMGPDGHTCSLFPGRKQLLEDKEFVTFIEDSPKPPSQRITLTVPVVNNASSVFFVITGKDKEPCIREIREGHSTVPSSRVVPTSGDCVWFVDPAAAGQSRVCLHMIVSHSAWHSMNTRRISTTGRMH